MNNKNYLKRRFICELRFLPKLRHIWPVLIEICMEHKNIITYRLSITNHDAYFQNSIILHASMFRRVTSLVRSFGLTVMI